MLIRRAKQGDVADIIVITNASYQMYVERMGKKPAPMLADYAALVEHETVFVSTDPIDRVTGFVVIVARQQSALIETVAVRVEMQGQGIGRALMQFAEDWLGAQNIPEVSLYTHVTMYENRRWYPLLGYRESGIVQEDGYERVYFSKILKVVDP